MGGLPGTMNVASSAPPTMDGQCRPLLPCAAINSQTSNANAWQPSSRPSTGANIPGTARPVPPPRAKYAGVHIKLDLCPRPYIGLIFVAKCARWPPKLLEEVSSWDTAHDRGVDGEVAFSTSNYKNLLKQFEELIKEGVELSSLPTWVCQVAGFERNGGPPVGGCPLPEAKEKVEQFLATVPEAATAVLPYQKESLAFGLHRGGRVLLGDEMGLGKTLQALLLAAHFQEEWPLLVVAPSSLRFVWRDQAAQWLPHLVGEDGQHVHVVRNSKDKVSKSAKVVVVTYDLLRRCESLRRCPADGRDYLVVIVDESQSIKESTTQRTKVVVGICKAARRVLLLSGTPAVNRASELYTQLEALLPSEMPSFAHFAERYSYKQTVYYSGRPTVKWNGAQRPSELNCLLSSVMIRRLKKDVLQQLPPKRRMKVPLDPEKMNQEILREVERQSKQMGAVDLNGKGSLGDTAQLFRMTAEAKLQAVLEYVEHLLSNGVKFLVFGHHHLMLDALQQKLQKLNTGFIRIDGHTSPTARPTLVSQFQEDESIRVAVLSITAAGTGLTLTAAQTIVFAELHWVPGQMQQAEDRAHRIGQRSCVTVHYLIAKKTLDEVLFHTLEKKTLSTTTILNGQSCGLDVSCQETFGVGTSEDQEPSSKRLRSA